MTKNKLGGKMSGVAILLGVALLGLLLIFIGNNGATDVKSDDGSAAREEIPCAQEYARSVEEKIIKLCSGVYGVKNISVVVSISGGYDAVYAQNSQSNSAGYKNEFVLVGNGSSEKALLVGYSAPKITGIGIVCTGGGTSYVKNEIISLVSATFDVSKSKIYVVEGQK